MSFYGATGGRVAGGARSPKQGGPPREGDFVVRDFNFRSGGTLPELRLHYLTLGRPARDARGEVTNAVLILHGTGGSGRQFLAPQFAGILYGPGAPLDTTRYYIVLPDGIGHGGSSKPSNGLRMGFPRYDYDDMVAAHHGLLTEHLGVRHLRLLMIAGSAPIQMQNTLASRDCVDRFLERMLGTRMAALDANDLLYQVDASRNYDPSPGLERIQVPVLFVNSADDFINPPELGIAEREIRRVKRGRFVLLPASEHTRGHGSHTWAVLWKSHLEGLLRETAR